MPNYVPYDYNQTVMLVINFEDQLQPGSFEHAIHYLIDHRLDMSVFDSMFQNDTTGRKAIDPAILLKIILFAYSKGITSSREIQWCCQTNVIFKALSCDTEPHFTTLASFVSRYPEQIEALFEQVLLVCDEQGLIGRELFAIDGCKMSSNAAKEWSGTFKELSDKRDKIQRQIQYHLQEHKKQDTQDSREEVRKKRTEQALETLNAAHDKIDRFLKGSSPRMGQGKKTKEVKSNITDNESCKMKTSKGTLQGFNGVAAVDKKHQIAVDAQAFGEGQEHHTLQPVAEAIKDRFRRLGLSDNIYGDGAIVTADTGFATEANNRYLHENGIDGYIPDNRFRSRDPKFAEQRSKYGNTKKKKPSGTIPASEFRFDAVNVTCQCPAGEALTLYSRRVDKHRNLKVFFQGRLSQCRHCELKMRCLRNPSSADDRTGKGRQVSFIIEKGKGTPSFTDWMKGRVDSDEGRRIYSHRMSVVEPVFGNIGTNKGLNRFSLRGKRKVQGQWHLYCMVHNIEKLANYGRMVT